MRIKISIGFYFFAVAGVVQCKLLTINVLPGGKYACLPRDAFVVPICSMSPAMLILNTSPSLAGLVYALVPQTSKN
jgi:hypothetical protein